MDLIAQRLFAASQRHSGRDAISMLDPLTRKPNRWSYERFADAALRLAQWFRLETAPGTPIVLFSEKRHEFYAAIAGAIYSGRPFVPLHPLTPPGRLRDIMSILEDAAIATDRPVDFGLKMQTPTLDLQKSLPAPAAAPEDVAGESLAYIVFTSGSTGVPKAVGVTRDNLNAFVENSSALFDFTYEDRISQVFQIGFDPMIADFVWALSTGACLCPLPALNLRGTAGYIEQEKISVWNSTPLFVRTLFNARAFAKSALFPSIRFSSFIGEKLDWGLISDWQRIAPNTVIENHYGPTETTMSISRYRVASPVADSASVPIGKPYPGQRMELIDAESRKAETAGELVISGGQVSPGYVKLQNRTLSSFTHMPWDATGAIWYKTGDIVRRNADGDFVFMSRNDKQVKILGTRLELGEVESHLSQALASAQVLAVFPLPDPFASSGDCLAAVLSTSISSSEKDSVLTKLARALPVGMIPKHFYCIGEAPLDSFQNNNGKLDRRLLAEALKTNSLKLITQGDSEQTQ